MSEYSMPLCTIFTKWPAPFSPICVTHGSPSAFAAMDSKIGLSVFQDSALPPGIIEGPSRAPSSPPDTPQPTKCSPRALIAFSRRIVSGKCALPASTMMSPGSIRSASWSIIASVGSPALTMMIAVRGFFSDATNSSIVFAGKNSPSLPCSVMSFSVRE